MPLIAEIGLNIKTARKEKKMTRQELSGLVGVAESELRAIEEGSKDVDLKLVYELAAILQMDVTDFFTTTATRNMIQDKIIASLDKCSELELHRIFFYIESIIRSNSKR